MKSSTLIFMISMITPIMNHPFTLGMTLILQTIMICLNMTMISKSSWYSYILFISIISGMMIMFMYMASIVSNKKFKFNKKILMIMVMMIIILTIINNNSTMEIMNKMTENKMNLTNLEEMKSTTKFFNMNKGLITILLIMILMVTMITITSLTSSFKGPLKKK